MQYRATGDGTTSYPWYTCAGGGANNPDYYFGTAASGVPGTETPIFYWSFNHSTHAFDSLGGFCVNGTCVINSSGLLLPAALLTGTTSTITGTALTATCDSGAATVTGAVVGKPVAVSTTDGTDVGGAFNVRLL